MRPPVPICSGAPLLDCRLGLGGLRPGSRWRRTMRRTRLRRRRLRDRRSAPDLRHYSVHLHRLALDGQDRREHAADRCRNLRVDFVGRDFKQRLIRLNRVADLLEPLRNRALKDRLAKLRHHHFYFNVRGTLIRLWRRRLYRRLLYRRLRRIRLWRMSGRCSRRSRAVDHRHHGIHFHRRAFADFDFSQHTRHARRNLCVHLVSGDFKQRLVLFHAVAGLLEPFGNGPLEDRLAHLGHDDISGHASLFRRAPPAPGSCRIINRALRRSSLRNGFTSK